VLFVNAIAMNGDSNKDLSSIKMQKQHISGFNI